MCSGFIHSQVLVWCVRLGLIELLEERDRSLAELAQATGVEPSRLQKMLSAAEALKLVEVRSNGDYSLGMLGAAQCGNDGLKALILHHDALYRDLVDPVAMAANAEGATRLNRYWAYACDTAPSSADAEAVAPYSEVMGSSQRMIAWQLAELGSLRDCGRLLDVGGGNGTLAIEIAKRQPQLRLTVVDLPAVADIARANIAREDLGERIEAVGLDFFRQPLPADHDALSLVRILHDHDDAEADALLRAACDALPPGGLLIVAEPMAGASAAGRLVDAYFSVYLLAMGQGRPRSQRDLRARLERAGFERIRRHRGLSPIISSVVTARRR